MDQEIDPLLKDLIADLNAAGIETFCSCQGKTSRQDIENHSHCDGAFVTLKLAVLRKVITKARSVGLHVSYGNRFITTLCGDENGYTEIIAKNLSFPAKMRELFGLKCCQPVER